MLTEKTINNAKKYCCDDISKIEGYNEAINSDKRYCCHHKNGIDKSHEEIKEKCLYYNRPAEELIFLEIGEHRRLHWQNLREETRQKLSGENNGMYGRKGEKSPMYGKGYLITGEKHPYAKQCTINGKTYGCLKDAYEDIKPKIAYCTFCYKYRNGEL